MAHIDCPGCRRRYVLPPSYDKLTFTCPRCDKTYHIKKTFNSSSQPQTKPTDPDYVNVVCPKCGESYRMPNNCGDIHWECRCGHAIVHKGKSSSKLAKESVVQPKPGHTLIQCPRCAKNYQVENTLGAVHWKCDCGRIIHFMGTGEATAKPVAPTAAPQKPVVQPKPAVRTPVAQPKPAPQPVSRPKPAAQPKPAPQPVSRPKPVTQPKPAPQPVRQYAPTRTVLLHRPDHSHKGLDGIGIMNMLKDAVPVSIYLDGEKVAVLSAKDPYVELKLDSREHQLSMGVLSAKCRIPAGNDSYIGYVFNGSIDLGIVGDPYREQVTKALLQIVRSQGFRDRINHPNNLNHAVQIELYSDHFLLYYTPRESHGFAQWASGRVEEKVYFYQLGLPEQPRQDRLPGGYWSNLEQLLKEAIVADEQADLIYTAQGYAPRTQHSLF